jgi:hypothetical protein
VPCVSRSQVSGLRVDAAGATLLLRSSYSIDVTWADGMVSALMAGASSLVTAGAAGRGYCVWLRLCGRALP